MYLMLDRGWLKSDLFKRPIHLTLQTLPVLKCTNPQPFSSIAVPLFRLHSGLLGSRGPFFAGQPTPMIPRAVAAAAAAAADAESEMPLV